MFKLSYPEIVYAYAIKALCDDLEFSQSDLCLCRLSVSVSVPLVGKSSKNVRHVRRIPVTIDMPPEMLPKKDQKSGKLIVQTQAVLHDSSPYERYDIGLREFVIFDPNQQDRPMKERDSVRFWHWNSEIVDHPLGFVLIVENKNLFRLRKYARSIEKHSATALSPPVLPRGMLTEIYKNTVGFLLDGKAKKEQYDEYNIPYKRGVLLCGTPGCVTGDTKIRIRKKLNKGTHELLNR